MKKPHLLLALCAALLGARAAAESPSIIWHPIPLRILPASATEPMTFRGDLAPFAAITREWTGSTLYIDVLPLEVQPSPVPLAQPYSFTAKAFHEQIRFLYFHRPAPSTPVPTDHKPSKINFNIGYQF